jgi:hypothetical protein
MIQMGHEISWQLAVGKKKENDTNGKYRYEALHDGCPHNKSFWESRTLFSKRVLAAGGILKDGF